MSQDPQDPVWKKIDEHNRMHTETAKEIAALKARQDAAETRMDRLLQLQAEHRSESKADSAQILKRIDSMHNEYHDEVGSINSTIDRARGGLVTVAWIIGTSIAVGTLILAAVKFFT